MRFSSMLCFIAFGLPIPIYAQSIAIPTDPRMPVPSVHITSERVQVEIDEQAASTRIDIIVRNDSDRPLEATLFIPLPKNATVNDFRMMIDGKEQNGELLDAKSARKTYEDIVRRIQDPGLLEYVDNRLAKVRLFPVPARSSLPCSLRFRSFLPRESGFVEYVLPMRGVNQIGLEFAIDLQIRSNHGISNIYSPSHAVDIERKQDKEAKVRCRQDRILNNRDFQLFFKTNQQTEELGFLFHRPVASEDGYFLLLANPSNDRFSKKSTPRDVVLVLDTSGSMDEVKMDQAKRALKSLLTQLRPDDRFGLVRFATAVETYRDQLAAVREDQKSDAFRWIDQLRAGGGTAIQPALEAALALKSSDSSRPFILVFLTDGQPTIGETRPEKILQMFEATDRSNIRVFPYGVGNDVNAVFLDRLAELTRADATYVRPGEEIDRKVTTLFERLANPALTDVRIESDLQNVRVIDRYPMQIPDLFRGAQQLIFGRFHGEGKGKVRLRGKIGDELIAIETEVQFPVVTDATKDFVPYLWAARKISFLLDQIRKNGESQEVVKELTDLAKKYAIATPYTSYLVVPDQPMPGNPRPPVPSPTPWRRLGLAPGFGGASPQEEKLSDLAKRIPSDGKPISEMRVKGPSASAPANKNENLERLKELDEAKKALDSKQKADRESGSGGVRLAEQSRFFKEQAQTATRARQQILGRNLVELNGIWLDENFDARMPQVQIKAFSDAYFQILQTRPEMKELLRQSARIVYQLPNGLFLLIDPQEGRESITEAEIQKWFTK